MGRPAPWVDRPAALLALASLRSCVVSLEHHVDELLEGDRLEELNRIADSLEELQGEVVGP